MAATVTTSPTYAVPNRPARVVFTPANGNCNFVRVWATMAPEGSAIRADIDKNKRNRALVYQGQPGATHAWRYTFEKGGAYTLVLQEYERGNGWGGGYEGDARGAPYETVLGSEQSLALNITQRMTMPLGTVEHQATLVLFVNNGLVVTTVPSVHGEASPAIVEPTSDRATAAAFDSSVTAAVVGLSGKTVQAHLLSSGTSFHLKTLMSELRSAWAGHLANSGGTYHDAADSDNVMPVALAPPGVDLSPDHAAASCSEMLRLMRQHYLNDNGEGLGSAAYHPVPDADNLPIMDGISDLAGAFAAVGDMRRSFTAHGANTTVHNPADSTNVVAAISTSSYGLAYIHELYMTALASTDATPPPGGTSAATFLVQQAGMTET